MRFRKAVSLLFVMAAFLYSCSKEKSNEIPVSDSTSYLPHTAGSFWHYEDTARHMGFKLVATDSMKTIEKIPFYYYENIPDSLPGDTTYTLIGEAENNYYVNAFLPEWGAGKLLILKQDGAVGESWTQEISYDSLANLPLTFKIVEKGISKTLYGHDFKKVFHVGMSVGIPLDNDSLADTPFSIQVGEVYFAAGIGIIEIDLAPPNMQDGAVHLLLTDYEIQ